MASQETLETKWHDAAIAAGMSDILEDNVTI